MPDNTYYVGKSSNIEERLQQHRSGVGGCILALKYVERVDPLTEYMSDFESWERNETLTRMYTHGISNVRGWMYTSPALGVTQFEHAAAQICEKFDLCRRCGYKGHFVGECNNMLRNPALCMHPVQSNLENIDKPM
jgi:hypothetical protein